VLLCYVNELMLLYMCQLFVKFSVDCAVEKMYCKLAWVQV